MNKIDNFRMKQLKKTLVTLIAIVGIVGVIFYGCTSRVVAINEITPGDNGDNNNTIRIEGTFTYDNINIEKGITSIVIPNWANIILGQTVMYEITSRPSGANEGSITINLTNGTISISANIAASDNGEYKIRATGTGDYAGSIEATIQVFIIDRNWSQLTNDAGFTGRSGHTSVVYNNEIYVIGGLDIDFKNDVWKSRDGVSWSRVTSTVQFPVRSYHTSVVLNDDIYVIGGSGLGGSSQNDVWRSSDAGVTWIEVATTSARFPVRRNHASVVLGDDIYVIGGSDGSSTNDVWKSSDAGTNWIEVTNAAAFPSRHGHTAEVFNGEIYVIGGTGGGNDVWKSSDGAVWTEVTTSTSTRFPARGGLISAVANGNMYVIGGNNLNDVWKSSDGRDWVQVTGNVQFPVRDKHTSVVLNGGIYVIGGFSSTGTTGSRLNDVWVYR